MSKLKVCIIGAGIVGLSTAIAIQQKHPSVKLTVIAEKFNTETTSDGAAGLFEPDPGFMGPDVNITRLQSGGADVIKRRLDNIEQLKDKFDIVFNCTGFGAKFLLDGDIKLVPIRGHVVQVIHNYRHGGYGVISAPGTAKYAVEIFEENHRLSARSKL